MKSRLTYLPLIGAAIAVLGVQTVLGISPLNFRTWQDPSGWEIAFFMIAAASTYAALITLAMLALMNIGDVLEAPDAPIYEKAVAVTCLVVTFLGVLYLWLIPGESYPYWYIWVD